MLAASNSKVQEALAPSAFPGFGPPEELAHGSRTEQDFNRDSGASYAAMSLARQLEELAHDIIATPGAGGALLAAYAAQARALTMVVEAVRRSRTDPLPEAVVTAAQEALATPLPKPELRAG